MRGAGTFLSASTVLCVVQLLPRSAVAAEIPLGWVDRAVEGTRRGVDKAAEGVKKGAEKGAEGVKKGAEKGAEGVKKGADKTKEGVDKATR